MDKGETYYKTCWFMTHDLKLKGAEKDVYAIIYGFQTTEGRNFCGSAKFIADWANLTVKGVRKAMKSLQNKGLLLVIKKNATRSEYRAIRPPQIREQSSPINEDDKASIRELSSLNKQGNVSTSIREQSSPNWGTQLPNIREQSSPNKINKINKINIDRLGLTKKIPDIPTREEVHEYVAKNNLKIDPDKYFDINEKNHWITVAGTPVRCWKNHLRFWSDTERPEKDYQNAMMHTQYDYNEIEQKLLRN